MVDFNEVNVSYILRIFYMGSVGEIDYGSLQDLDDAEKLAISTSSPEIRFERCVQIETRSLKTIVL